MKRTTMFIPETLERDLQLYARRHRRPVASVIREAVERYLTDADGDVRLPSFAGVGASGRDDVAERHEDMLFAELEPHGNRVTRQRARRSATRKGAKRRKATPGPR